MASGSIREAKFDGISFAIAADANIALTPRVEKESVPHSGGNSQKETLVAGNATGVKVIATPSEFSVLESIAADPNTNIPLSYAHRDGSVFRTQGSLKLGEYMSEDQSVECELLTSTGDWDIFAAT